jgi:membrane protein involved in colicin uptake
MTEDTKTPEQLAAEAKAAAEAKKASDKEAAAKVKAEKKAAADAEKAEKAKAKEAEKADAKAKKEAEAKAKADAKAAQEAAKQTQKMPEQNGVRRPRPGGSCAKVWDMADTLSAQLGQPVPIANLSKDASAAGINDSTIRTQYALWRKFHGVTGRVALPVQNPTSTAGSAADTGAAASSAA